jgi:hypothetical protein
MYAPNRIAHYVCALVAVWDLALFSYQHTLAQGAEQVYIRALI